MPGNNMKAVRGGGARRTKDPDVDMDLLLDKLRNHIKACAIPACAFDLGLYNNLAVSYACHGKSLFQVRDLLKLFLEVSPSAKIGYVHFKSFRCNKSAPASVTLFLFVSLCHGFVWLSTSIAGMLSAN